MATRANSSPASTPETGKSGDLSGFIASCLAPLPKGEEQAASPQYLRLLERISRVEWDGVMEEVKLADALHTAAAIRDRRDPTRANQLACWTAWSHWCHAVRAVCAVPAPSAKEFRWKLRQSRCCEMDDLARAQIAADRLRFEGADA